MSRSLAHPLAAALLGALVGLAGCGDDDIDTTTTAAGSGGGGQGGAGGAGGGEGGAGGAGGAGGGQGGAGGGQGGAGGAGGAGGGQGGAGGGIDPCADGVHGEGETDVDCGGLCPPCGNGSGCLEDADCDGGGCADGVCCDSACDGPCVSCIQAHTGFSDGHCAPVPFMTDPNDECAETDPASCGTSGVCNGDPDTPACLLHGSEAVCGPAYCEGALLHKHSQCDGAGTCVPGQIGLDCAPGVCDPDTLSCQPDTPGCDDDADCGDGNACADGVCFVVCAAVNPGDLYNDGCLMGGPPLAFAHTTGAALEVARVEVFTGEVAGNQSVALATNAGNQPGVELGAAPFLGSAQIGWQGGSFDAPIALDAATQYWVIWDPQGNEQCSIQEAGTQVTYRGFIDGAWNGPFTGAWKYRLLCPLP